MRRGCGWSEAAAAAVQRRASGAGAGEGSAADCAGRGRVGGSALTSTDVGCARGVAVRAGSRRLPEPGRLWAAL